MEANNIVRHYFAPFWAVQVVQLAALLRGDGAPDSLLASVFLL